VRSFLLVAALACAASAAAQTSDPRIALMERAAWNALANGQTKTAADIFREALASDPRNAELHVGAAAAAFADRRDDDAKNEVDRALSLDAKLTPRAVTSSVRPSSIVPDTASRVEASPAIVL